MKKWRVTLYVGEDKQWVFAWGDTSVEACVNAMSDITIGNCEEVDDEDDEY